MYISETRIYKSRRNYMSYPASYNTIREFLWALEGAVYIYELTPDWLALMSLYPGRINWQRCCI